MVETTVNVVKSITVDVEIAAQFSCGSPSGETVVLDPVEATVLGVMAPGGTAVVEEGSANAVTPDWYQSLSVSRQKAMFRL